MSTPSPLAQIDARLVPLRGRLLSHPVYDAIRDLAGLTTFMEHHVFAVWDFMSLVKTLQRQLTTITVPWTPPADPISARMINEIVLGEETDLDDEQRPLSHFDLYRSAMTEAGASLEGSESLIRAIRAGTPLEPALAGPAIPPAAAEFVRQTFRIIDSGDMPTIVSAFAFGREDLLPRVFRRLVADISQRFPHRLGRFLYYLDRHISLDGEAHGPLAMRLVTRACGDDPELWKRAEEAAVASLEARIALWDAMAAKISASAPA